ncbi:hypothetical protein KKG56_10550 [bacterium]|nr:hypothetical protein [bacterium]
MMRRFIVVLVVTYMLLSAGMIKSNLVYAGDVVQGALQGALIGGAAGILIDLIQSNANKPKEQKEMKEEKNQNTYRAKDLVIKLKDIKVDISDANFYIEDVIDSRVNKNDIGSAMTGSFNKITPVQLEGGLSESLLKFFSYSLPKSDNKIPIVVNILNLRVEEKKKFSVEYAESEIEMDFCLRKGDKIGQIYQARSVSEKQSLWDATLYHEANIRWILSDCLKSFANHKWTQDDVTFREMEVFKSEVKSIAVQTDTSNKKKKDSKMYVGIVVPYQSIKGDLDGKGILTNPNGEILIVPELQSDIGTGIVFGTRYPDDSKKNNREYVIEMSYVWSDHRAEWMGVYGDASNKVFSLDYRPYFQLDKKTQPFLSLGFAFCTLVVKNGASLETRVGDATFQGYRFNIGGGISHSLSKHLLLNGSLIYSFGDYTSAKGVEGKFGKINDKLNVKGINPALELKYSF